jgi:predicted phosphate transport protein (TIGR00153 family)
MLFNFFPKDVNFFELFEKQSLYNVQAAEAFRIAVSGGTLDKEALAKVVKLEAAADEATHAVIMQLNKSFITPFDREDIHSLTKALDDIIDMMNTISNRLNVYKITDVKKNLIEFALVMEASAKAIDTAVKGLKDMKNYDLVMASCMEISRLENISDSMRDTALAGLFENEKDPIVVIKWKELYEEAETVMDICADAAHVVESIMIKQA